LDSYLIEITALILRKKEENVYVIDTILDAAGQKGTGKWTAQVALDLGIPVTLIGEAVFARSLSALKEQRVAASKVLTGPKIEARAALFQGEKREQFIEAIKNALYASKIISYAQGFTLMKAAAHEFKWKLNYGGVALMWRGGCIIRSKFLGKIKEAFDTNPELENLLLNPFFKESIDRCQEGWRQVACEAMLAGIPIPAKSCALAYYDGIRTERLPANLLQAQRDFFGAHTYERVDKPSGEFYHTNWTGQGGNTHATSYSA